MERQREITASAAYKAGDPETVAARYRIHFRHGLRQAADYDKLMARMSAAHKGQTASGKRGPSSPACIATRGQGRIRPLAEAAIAAGPHVGDRRRARFHSAEIAAQIANALPRATLDTIEDCGHFAYLECGTEVRKAIDKFFSR